MPLQIGTLQSGHILDLYCDRLSKTAPCCENYTKLYFDAEHSEKGLNRKGGVKFLVSFAANIERCLKFLEYALTVLEI